MLNISQITVRYGRTFNDPHERFSNHRPEVTLTANVVDRENFGDAIKTLQAVAAQIVNDERDRILHQSDDQSEAETKARELAFDQAANDREIRIREQILADRERAFAEREGKLKRLFAKASTILAMAGDEDEDDDDLDFDDIDDLDPCDDLNDGINDDDEDEDD